MNNDELWPLQGVDGLLVTVPLGEPGVLTEPLLYLSLYLKQHRDEYFAHLQAVRERGTWEEWCFRY